MANSLFPFLSLLIVWPLAAGIGLLALAGETQAKRYALAAAGLELGLSLSLLAQFHLNSGEPQWLERHVWIDSLNIYYCVGVDGISLLFLPLTALLNFCVMLASWTTVHTLPKLYFTLLLWLEAATMGVFCALDLGLFFLFWELTLPPLYFLLSLWGIGPLRRHAATRYTMTMLAGGVPLLLGFVVLALNHAHEVLLHAPWGLSFDYATLLETPMPMAVQTTVLLLLLLGFAVKAPLFPFHAWLPTAAMEGPIGVAALLTGLKLGLYGIIRFAIPLAPQAAQKYSQWLVGLGILGALYGALIALRQTNLRRMLAFSSISHVGLVLIGIAAFNLQGIQGAVLQLWNFSLFAGGLFLTAGFLYHRQGSTDLTALGGVARTMPLLASVLLVFGLAGMGVPGSNGFVAEHLIVLGAFKSHTGIGIASLAVAVLGAAGFLAFQRSAIFGPPLRRSIREAVDLRAREWLIVGPLSVLTIAGGICPQILLDYSRKPLQAWVARLENGHTQNLAKAEVKTMPSGFGPGLPRQLRGDD